MRRMLLAFAIALAAPALAAPKPAVSVASTSVDEGTAATVRAKRTGDLTRSSSVIFSTSNATAISGVNYTGRSGTLTFAPGQALSSSALVSTLRDGKVTPNLYFIVRLGVVSNATIQANGTVTVRNLDHPPPPATQTCPDGSVIPASSTCPSPPPPPPPTGWVSAPLQDGGYARCKTAGGCHSFSYPCFAGTTPPNCSYPDIIAQQGDVRQYKWNGVTYDNRPVAALWPNGQYMTPTPYIGVEGLADEWEGVASR